MGFKIETEEIKMKMINVLQRLAELDADNPNVVYEGSQKEKSKEEKSVEENNGAHGGLRTCVASGCGRGYSAGNAGYV